MINLDTIISAFNDKLTLLQWLKNVNKALEDGILTSVDVERVNVDKVKINFTFADGTKQTTNTFDLKTFEGLTELERLIKGSESVVVDVNEEGNALEVHLDAEVLQRIYKTLVLPASAPTSEELVGIDETGAQSRVTIGEGLSIENGTLKASVESAIYKHKLKVSSEGVEKEYYIYTTKNTPYTNYREFANDVENIINCYLINGYDLHNVMIYATIGTGAFGFYINNVDLQVVKVNLPSPLASIVSDLIVNKL